MIEAALRELAESPALAASAVPTMILDLRLRVWGINPAFEQVSLRGGADLVGEEVLVAFPDNPDDPAGAGGRHLVASIERVITRKERHHLGLIRYDITSPEDPDVYLTRLWSPVNTPIFESGRVIGVMQQVEDVTTLAQDPETARVDPTQLTRLAVALANANAELAVVEDQNRQLRDALISNRMIGVAVGIIMSQQRLSRDEAFALLRAQSQRSNRKVRELAELIAHAGSVRPLGC